MSSKDSLNSYNKFLDCSVDETTRLTIRTVDMVTVLMEILAFLPHNSEEPTHPTSVLQRLP